MKSSIKNNKAKNKKKIINSKKNKKKKNINNRNIIFTTSIILILLFLLIISISLNLSLFNKKNKVHIKYKYILDENIVFYGDSITYKYEIEHFFPKNKIINSGISGDKSEDLINRLENDVYKYNPSKVFILIGINDLNHDIDKNEILNNIQSVITGIRINRKLTKIYIESIYPINRKYMKKNEYNFNKNLTNDDIIHFNNDLKKLAIKNKITYINVYDSLVDKDGNLKRKYTKEGLHLNDIGYLRVSAVLEKYINEK